MPELSEQELQRIAYRRGCILKALIAWFSILALIILVMIFVRSRVNRNPEEIAKYVDGLISMELPPGFRPYSKNYFKGVHLVSYWDVERVREDGRTSGVFAIYFEDAWKNRTLEDIEKEVVADLKRKLTRQEFRTHAQTKERVLVDGQEITIHMFSGLTRYEDQYLEAATCYRFLQGSQGIIQVHTMSLLETLSEQDQINFLSTIKAK